VARHGRLHGPEVDRVTLVENIDVGRPAQPQVLRARIFRAPTGPNDSLTVIALNYTSDHDYEAPAGQWTSPTLPAAGDECVLLLDDDGDAWVVHGGMASGGAGPVSGTYVHTQGTPATTWTVTHGLGYFPNVTAVDSLNRAFIADVTYASVNQLTITLTAATAGKAYVS